MIENLSINNDAGAIGTVDYLQAPSQKINAPQASQIKDLEGDYNICPGHGLCSTLSHERIYNPLMSRV